MKFPEKAPEGKGLESLLKIEPEQSVVGVFRGELFEFRQHWDNRKPFECTGAACALCKAGSKSSYRFRLNFIMKENAVLIAKTFEQGWMVREQLEELNKEYPLEATFVKITRKGNGTDTTYTILPQKNGLLNKQQEADVLKVKLNVYDPAAVAGAKAAAVATSAPETEDEAVGF